ncbi:exocyst complex component exo70 subunit [Multifurca ochricompacta]|uniref:Exocyst complex protein EXO70 n=1 Tax=Multifurca ochricompacta TaxID=376703 RepID=A0AAD4M5J8_9AGAM|nr:exocyst complex component exo70 subunit [Multifurca ochricompacta]
MDDETAEIELLEQNLNKTRQISQRMTSILTSFDNRLVKLEKSILPLYTSTQILTKRGNNIESALQKIDEVASNQEGIAAEEALILRGPQPDQLGAYTDALERLNANIAFGAADENQRDTARLVETGANKLAQLFTKIVASGSSGNPPAGSEFRFSPFPLDTLVTLSPLVKFLRSLPLPATHPSHPSATAILSALKEAQRGYAEMRGNWGRKCLEVYGRRLVDRAETTDGISAGRELGRWTSDLLDVIEEEYNLLTQLAPLPGQAHFLSTYIALLTPLTTLFNTALSSLSTLIKRSLPKYNFHALASYSALSACQDRWDELVIRRSERKENEFKEGLHAVRGVCVRSFPEFLADLKLAGLGRGGEIGTGCADFTISTTRYLEQLLEVRDAVGSILMLLGDGNWKMGDGVQVKPNQGKPAPGSESLLIDHYTYDVVTTLITSLTTLSRMQKRPAFGSVFLLNNTAYLCAKLLRPRAPVLEIISRPTKEAINSNFRTAKAGYFDSNFSPLVQALADDKDKPGGGGKAAAKEKFTRFFDLLEETKERHQLARVLEDDEEQRQMLEDEVVKLVVPSLQRFTQKMREKEFSKNPSKYIKMTPEEVEAQIRSFY